MIEAVFGTFCAVLASDIWALCLQQKRWYEERRSYLDVDAGRLANPQEAGQYLALPLERVPRINFGQAWLGRASAGLPGLHAAKTAHLDCPLGAARARQELIKDATHAVQIPKHPALCAALGWCWHSGTPCVLWELVPSTSGTCMKKNLQSHFTRKSSPFLLQKLVLPGRCLVAFESAPLPFV